VLLKKKEEEERRFTPKGGGQCSQAALAAPLHSAWNKGIHSLLISLKVGLDNNYKNQAVSFSIIIA
jgi:hypothetical protein